MRKERQEKRDREFEQERMRIKAQRALFVAIQDSTEKNWLEKGMLDRAWKLLDLGKLEEADAILEFLPEDKAVALLEEYFFEPLGKENDKAD